MRAWDDFIKNQEVSLGTDVVKKWLHSLKVSHFDSGNLYLEAKDSFQIVWFEEHIRPLLRSQFLNNNFRPIQVHLTLGTSQAPTLDVKGLKREKGMLHPQVHFIQDKLDPAMTLQNFVSGEANKIIFQLFCELTGYHPETEKLETPVLPLATFNPIYLWGGSGSGKTHLLMALAQAFKKQGLNALYARAETFTEHVVSAIRGSEMQFFRKAYRHVDVLLIDDVHAFARKNATQEEFFHTFNTLHTSGRQIVLSCKCAPALLEEIEPRLVSRFEWGINIHFEKLDLKDLRQVLQKRCEGLNFPLSEEVSQYLIEAFPSSRALQCALEALVLRCHLEEDARHTRNSALIRIEFAQRMLADLVAQEQKNALSPDKIISAVSAKYGIREGDLLSKSQSQECSLPRQIAMYLCREELRLPFQTIGRIFSRDHSTVMTSIRQIEKKLETSDKELFFSLSEIRASIDG